MVVKLLLQNPKKGDPPNAGLDEKADFGAEKQKKFQGYAWLGAIDPSMLDNERCELLLIAASKDVQGRLHPLLHAVQQAGYGSASLLPSHT